MTYSLISRIPFSLKIEWCLDGTSDIERECQDTDERLDENCRWIVNVEFVMGTCQLGNELSAGT